MSKAGLELSTGQRNSLRKGPWREVFSRPLIEKTISSPKICTAGPSKANVDDLEIEVNEMRDKHFMPSWKSDRLS